MSSALQTALSKVKDLVGNVSGRAETFVSKEAEDEGAVKHIDAFGEFLMLSAGIMRKSSLTKALPRLQDMAYFNLGGNQTTTSFTE